MASEKERKVLKAKPCYEHLGGSLGNRLFKRMIELNWFEPDEDGTRNYRITEIGKENLEKLGVDLCDHRK